MGKNLENKKKIKNNINNTISQKKDKISDIVDSENRKVKLNKRKKKFIFISSICIVVITFILFLAYYFFGNIYLKINKSGNNNTIEVSVGNKDYIKPKVKCKFFNNDISLNNLKIIKELNVSKLGKQQVVYECRKSFFKKKIVIKYNVVDKEAPVLEVDSDDNISIYVGDEYKEPTVKAIDNYDGDITDKIKKSGSVDNQKEGIYEVIYSIRDSSGNESSKKITVEVKVRPVQNVVPRQNVVYSTSTNISCGDAGTIYLTFDDGPNDLYTPIILDVLKKYGVKATFFITSGGSDSLVKREYDEGHSLGIHTSSHRYDVVYSSSESFWNDMNVVKDRIERITGSSTVLMRFPGGSSNTVSRHYNIGIMGRLAQEIEANGYEYFDWNISSGDAGGTTNPDVEYSNVVNSLSKSRGNVILMHDIKYHTSQAIASIVKYGLDNGYTFDILNKNIICHQAINN